MSRYANGRIYKLQSKDHGFFYIGSTCAELYKRLGYHKKASIYYPERNVYKVINLLGWDDIEIVLIKNFECNSKEELTREEDFHIRKDIHNKLCLNTNRACLSLMERENYFVDYRKKHATKISEYQKTYRCENKDVLLEKARQKINCECGGKTTYRNKAQHEKSKKHQLYNSRCSINTEDITTT
jgi:hypothetical protein